MMQNDKEPIPISGPKAAGPNAVPQDRKVVWKRVCLIQDSSKAPNVAKHQAATLDDQTLSQTNFQNLVHKEAKNSRENIMPSNAPKRECILEMSRTKTKFYIVAVDLETFKYHVIELFRFQANKIIKAVDNNLIRLMEFLEFKFGTLCIKDQELLLQYQLYMSPSDIRVKQFKDLRQKIKMAKQRSSQKHMSPPKNNSQSNNNSKLSPSPVQINEKGKMLRSMQQPMTLQSYSSRQKMNQSMQIQKKMRKRLTMPTGADDEVNVDLDARRDASPTRMPAIQQKHLRLHQSIAYDQTKERLRMSNSKSKIKTNNRSNKNSPRPHKDKAAHHRSK